MPLRVWIVDLVVVAATAAVVVWLKPEAGPPSRLASPPAATAPQPGATGDPEWNRLSASDQRLLAPLEPMWKTMTEDQRGRWRRVAARVQKESVDEQRRVQARMVEWARLTPKQRADARLHFVQAKHRSSAQQRRERWRQYVALAPEHRPLVKPLKVPESVSPADVRPGPGGTTMLVTQLN